MASLKKKIIKQACVICDKEAVGRHTVDIDINGLGYCKKHKSKVGGLITWLIISPELYEKMLSLERGVIDHKENKKNKIPKPKERFVVKAKRKNGRSDKGKN